MRLQWRMPWKEPTNANLDLDTYICKYFVYVEYVLEKNQYKLLVILIDDTKKLRIRRVKNVEELIINK